MGLADFSSLANLLQNINNAPPVDPSAATSDLESRSLASALSNRFSPQQQQLDSFPQSPDLDPSLKALVDAPGPSGVKDYLAKSLYQGGEAIKQDHGVPTNVEAQQAVVQHHRNRFLDVLRSMAYAGGQAGLHESGVGTDGERAEMAARTRGLNTDADFRQAQIEQMKSMVTLPNGLQVPFAIAQKIYPELSKAANTPVTITPDMAKAVNMPELAGESMTQRGWDALVKQRSANQGKVDVANVGQGLQIPLTPELAKEIGRPELEGKSFGAKQIKQLLGVTGANKQITAVGNRLQLVDKATGAVIKDLGENPNLAARVAGAEAMAQSRAKWTPFSTIDTDQDSPTYGQPITISNLSAIQTGAVPGGKINTQQVLTGLSGLGNYKDALTTQRDTVGVLDNNVQRLAIARTLQQLSGTHELGMIDSFLNAKLQDGTLTPEAVKFIGATKLAQEFIGANRQFAGNFRGSQALYNTMISNVANPAMNSALANQFINQDINATDKIEKRFSFQRPNPNAQKKPLTMDVVRQYMTKANGNKAEAMRLAAADGYQVEQ